MTQEVGRPRGRYARTAERRRAIAESVIDIVEEVGHDNLTTAEVARRSGSSEPTVMYHFPTKDHLLVGALEHLEATGVESVADEPVRAMDLTALADVIRADTKNPNLMRLQVTVVGLAAIEGHPAEAYLRQRTATAIAVFSAMIEEGQRTGTAHPGLDPADVARQITATWDGLRVQWLTDPSFDLADMVVAAVRRLTGQNWMEIQQLVRRAEARI